MSRVKRGVTTHARHVKVIKLAKGYRGRAKNCYRVALQFVERAMAYAYRDRRNRKRDMRALWIQRINAAARANGMVYSEFMYLLKQHNSDLNRKILADMAVNNPKAFAAILQSVSEKAA